MKMYPKYAALAALKLGQSADALAEMFGDE